MDQQLQTLLSISLILVTGLLVIFLVFLIQLLNVLKRIATKIEIRIDNFEITAEEIKLKILNFVEEVIVKIKGYGKTTKSKVMKKLDGLEEVIGNEKKD